MAAKGQKLSSSSTPSAAAKAPETTPSGSPTFRVVMLNAPASLKHKEVSMPLKELLMTSGLQRNLREGLPWAPVCTWYTLGNCRNGENCNYIHPKWTLVEKYEWKGVAPHCDADARERIVQANSKLAASDAGSGTTAPTTKASSVALIDAVEALGRQPTTAGDQLICVMHVLRNERKNLTPLRSEVSNAWIRHFDATDKAVRNRAIEEAVRNRLLVATGGVGADARLCFPDIAQSLGVVVEPKGAAAQTNGNEKANETTRASGKQATAVGAAQEETLAPSQSQRTRADSASVGANAPAAREGEKNSNASNPTTTTTVAKAPAVSPQVRGWKSAAAAAPASEVKRQAVEVPKVDGASPAASSISGPRWAGPFGATGSRSAARAALDDAPTLEESHHHQPPTPPVVAKQQQLPAAPSSASAAVASADDVAAEDDVTAAEQVGTEAVVVPQQPIPVPSPRAAAREEDASAASVAVAAAAAALADSPLGPSVVWDFGTRTGAAAMATKPTALDTLEPVAWSAFTFRTTPLDSPPSVTPQESPPRLVDVRDVMLEVPKPARGDFAAADITSGRDRYEYVDAGTRFNCVCCHFPAVQPVELPCEHLMCKACLMQQQQRQHAAVQRCPACKVVITAVTAPSRSIIQFLADLLVVCRHCGITTPRSGFDDHSCSGPNPAAVMRNAELRIHKGEVAIALQIISAFWKLSVPLKPEDQAKLLCLETNALCKLDRHEEALLKAREAVRICDAADCYYRLAQALSNTPTAWSETYRAYIECLTRDPGRMDARSDKAALEARMQAAGFSPNALVRANAPEFTPPPAYVLPKKTPPTMITNHVHPDTLQRYYSDHQIQKNFWYLPDPPPPPPAPLQAQGRPRTSPPLTPPLAPQGAALRRPPPPPPTGAAPPYYGAAAGPAAAGGGVGNMRPPPQYSTPPAGYASPPPPPPPSMPRDTHGGHEPHGQSFYAPHQHYRHPAHPHMVHHHHHLHHAHMMHHMAAHFGGSPAMWNGERRPLQPPVYGHPSSAMPAAPHYHHQAQQSIIPAASSTSALLNGSSNSSAPLKYVTISSKAVNI